MGEHWGPDLLSARGLISTLFARDSCKGFSEWVFYASKPIEVLAHEGHLKQAATVGSIRLFKYLAGEEGLEPNPAVLRQLIQSKGLDWLIQAELGNSAKFIAELVSKYPAPQGEEEYIYDAMRYGRESTALQLLRLKSDVPYDPALRLGYLDTAIEKGLIKVVEALRQPRQGIELCFSQYI